MENVVGDDIVGQQGTVRTRIIKDIESLRTLTEGYFLQWKDTASNRTEQNYYSHYHKEQTTHIQKNSKVDDEESEKEAIIET